MMVFFFCFLINRSIFFFGINRHHHNNHHHYQINQSINQSVSWFGFLNFDFFSVVLFCHIIQSRCFVFFCVSLWFWRWWWSWWWWWWRKRKFFFVYSYFYRQKSLINRRIMAKKINSFPLRFQRFWCLFSFERKNHCESFWWLN